jgi:L-asparaginase II
VQGAVPPVPPADPVPPVPLVRVIRSGLEESVHHGDVVAVDAAGRVLARAGDPERPLFARSSMKPLQAAVSLSLATAMPGFDPPAPEVAVMCASHNGEPVHLEAVRSLLARAGVPESALRCTPKRPWDQESMIADPQLRAVNSDCSGKHAGMLAACVAQGWPLESYRDPEHPLQRAMTDAVRAASGADRVRIGVDGCGAPVHGLALRGLATIFARLAAPETLGPLEPHARGAVAAMLAQPYLVAGRDRVDTAVMEVAPNVMVKAGAEAVVCAAVPDRGIGIAAKIGDGGWRAVGPAVVRALRLLDVLDDGQVEALAPHARTQVLGGGRPVGELVADFTLSR